MTASALAPDAAAAVSALRLPVKFARGDVVHLADLVPNDEVDTWGDLPVRYPPGGMPAWQAEVRASDTRWNRGAIGVVALLVAFGLLALWIW